MRDLGAWRAAPSSNPAASRSQLLEPQRERGSLLLPLAFATALATIMALTTPNKQREWTTESSHPSQPVPTTVDPSK